MAIRGSPAKGVGRDNWCESSNLSISAMTKPVEKAVIDFSAGFYT